MCVCVGSEVKLLIDIGYNHQCPGHPSAHENTGKTQERSSSPTSMAHNPNRQWKAN